MQVFDNAQHRVLFCFFCTSQVSKVQVGFGAAVGA